MLTEFFSKKASETHESASFYVCILCWPVSAHWSVWGPLAYRAANSSPELTFWPCWLWRESFSVIFAHNAVVWDAKFFFQFFFTNNFVSYFGLMVPENFYRASCFVRKRTSRDRIAAHLGYFVLFTRIFGHLTTKNSKSIKKIQN